MRLGVDLGTTWTAAAVHTGDGCEAVQLAEHTIAMPSVVAVADGELIAGDAAERRLASEPAAGAREFKRRLGDSAPYVLAGAPYGAEALMAELLRHAVATAEAQTGERADAVVLTHPANWGEFKLDLLREAGRLAGLDGVELMSEPEAAARHYAHLGRLQPGQAVAVFDFGGGTFDAAVVRNGDDGPELLGTPEGLERLGGVDVDHAVLTHVDAALDGRLRELDTTDPAVRTGLARLRAECTAAKETLSSQTEGAVRVNLPGLDTEVRITRGELEQVVRQRMDDMLGALHRTVASSGLPLEDLSGVLLVGGSSRMPAVAEMVSAATGLPTLLDADPKLVVAAGAAWPRGAVEAAAAPTASADAALGGRGAAGRSDATPARRTERSERLRRAVSIIGATAAAGAVAVGGYAAYEAWWGGDDAGASGPSDAEAAALLVAGMAEEMAAMEAAAESLDAFDAPVGGSAAPLGGFAAPAAPAVGGHRGGGVDGGPVFAPPSRPPASPPRPQHDAPERPRPAPTDDDAAGRPVTMRPADLFSDPELDQVRMQLRERISSLDLPDGTDPAAAAKLRGDLEGLVDRFRAYPGQSVDDAVASLRYEFEDRVRDFAQDQRIDALIEEQRRLEEEGETLPPTDASTADPATGDPQAADAEPPADAPATDGADQPTGAPDTGPAEVPADGDVAPDDPTTDGGGAGADPGGLADVFDDAPAPWRPVEDDPPPPADPTNSMDGAATAVAPAPADDVLGTGAVAEAVATQPTPAPAAAVAPAVEPPPTEEPPDLHILVAEAPPDSGDAGSAGPEPAADVDDAPDLPDLEPPDLDLPDVVDDVDPVGADPLGV